MTEKLLLNCICLELFDQERLLEMTCNEGDKWVFIFLDFVVLLIPSVSLPQHILLYTLSPLAYDWGSPPGSWRDPSLSSAPPL